MTAQRDMRSDEGGAIVEFLGVTVVILVPLVYLIVTLAQLQGGAFAAEAAARVAARTAVSTGIHAIEDGSRRTAAMTTAMASAERVVALAADDAGITGATAQVDCSGTCLNAGTSVVVDVTMPVRIPGVPEVLGAVLPLTIPVSAEAYAPVPGGRE